jgi:uncharacterized membrane protein
MHIYFTRLMTLSLALFSFFISVVVLLTSWSPLFREEFVDLVKTNHFFATLLSIVLLSLTCFLLSTIWAERRRKQFYFRNAQGTIHVHRNLIKSHIQNYLEKTFKNQQVHCEVFVKKHKLAIECCVPFVPQEAQEGIAKTINEEVACLLSEQLGYTKRFSLALSYEPELNNL